MTLEQFEQFIDDLGTKLGPAAQHIYEIAVRQAIVTGAIWTAIGCVTLLVAVAGLVIALWATKRRDDDAQFGGAALSLFAGVATAGILANALPLLLNPEWSAIQTLLAAAKP